MGEQKLTSEVTSATTKPLGLEYTEKLHKKPYLCTGNRTEI